MLLHEAVRIWELNHARKLKSYRTIQNQLVPLLRGLGHIKVSELTSVDLSEYRDRRLQRVGPQTVIHELSIVNRTLKFHQQELGMPFPDGIPRTRNPKKPRGRDRRLRGDEFERILSFMRDQRMRLLFRFLLETGMRRGEAIASEWNDIDIDSRLMHIPETKTGIPRTIPLTTKAVEVLRAVYRNFPVEERPFPYPSADCATAVWWKARRKAGVEGLNVHDLRHEAVSRFFEKGLNMMEVASISGHQDLAMLKRYTHLKPESLLDRIG